MILMIFLASLAIIGAFIVWFSLLIRASLLLIAIAFAPIALAGASWDHTRGWVARWASFVIAMILSKVVLVVIFLLATEQVTAPIGADLQSVSQPIAGVVLMLMAGFAPYLTYKAIAFMGFDMYHAMSAEQEAKSALNRPMPIPLRQPGAQPAKVLNKRNSAPAAVRRVAALRRPQHPPGVGTRREPAASGGGGAGGGSTGGSSAGASGGGAKAGGAVGAGAMVAKESAAAARRLGGHVAASTNGHAAQASQPSRTTRRPRTSPTRRCLRPRSGGTRRERPDNRVRADAGQVLPPSPSWRTPRTLGATADHDRDRRRIPDPRAVCRRGRAGRPRHHSLPVRGVHPRRRPHARRVGANRRHLGVALHRRAARLPATHPQTTACGTLALPGDAARLRQWVDAETGAVMVHDPHAATLTAIVGVTHPAFVLLDPAEQERRVVSWGRVLATACRSGRLASLQVMERTLPDSGKGLADWWDRHGTHDDTWASRRTPTSSTAPDPPANATPAPSRSPST